MRRKRWFSRLHVEAADDAQNLYLRLTFKLPAGGANKGDADNATKVTVLFPNDKVPQAAQVGLLGDLPRRTAYHAASCQQYQDQVCGRRLRSDAVGQQGEQGQ